MRTVSDVMTHNPIVLSRDATGHEAAKAMRDRGIGDVLVTDGDQLSGIVTDRDLVVRCIAEGQDASQVHLGDIQTDHVATMGPDDSVESAVSTMRDHAVRRLPVVDDGRVVGIVSIGDLAIERDPDSALADISAAPANT
jgi:CBS domain-containing protein